MTTETIEWFTPEEKIPVNGESIACVYMGYSYFGYTYFDGVWEDADGYRSTSPQFWAYMPKGPE